MYLHKLDLSVQADNSKLASFYVHELEEISEQIAEEIESYDGFPIGDLTESMLVPQAEAMEEAITTGEARQSFKRLIDTCNGCHAATEHGHIRITHFTNYPFNQEFSN